jgi:cellulose synthase/poly-beta-1,6-N-acetylglucosamine synthase-like glycosyltransferase/peptidoglycan/xylan/chitin deacetylase (PgdA/CDA1 family)
MNQTPENLLQDKPVFYDPTGKRWNVAKVTFVVLTVLIIILSFFAIKFLFENFQYASKATYFQEKNNQLNIQKNAARKTFAIINPEIVQDNNFNSLKQNYKTLDNVILDVLREKNGEFVLEIDILEAVLVYFKTDTKSSISILVRENQLENVDKLKKFLDSDEFKKQANKYSFNSIYLSMDHAWYLNTVNEIHKDYSDKLNISYIIDSKFDYKSISKSVRKPKEVILNLDITKENELTDNTKSEFFFQLKNNLNYLANAELGSNLMLPSTSYYKSSIKLNEQKVNKDFASLNSILTDNSSLVSDNLIPKIKINQNQYSIIGNWFYYNFINELKIQGFNDNKTSLGIKSISESDPDSLIYFKSIKNWNDERNNTDKIYNFNYKHDVITEGEGLIQTFVQDEFYGKVELDINDDYISKITIKTQPKQAKIQFSGKADKTIAITFDDGPSSFLSKEVLKVLQDKGVKATFFVTGVNANKYPETIKQIAREGHQVENHSYSHTKLSDIVDEQIEWEITETNRIIENLTGRKPKFFRTPYNAFGYVASSIDLTTTKFAQRHGMQLYEVDTDSKDYKNNNSEEQLKSIFSNIGTQILFHDGLNNYNSKMPEALGLTIDKLKNEGYKFVTIDGYQNTNPSYKLAKENILTPITDKIAIINQNSWFYNFYIWFVFAMLLLSLLRSLILAVTIIIKRKPDVKIYYYDKPVTVIVPSYNEQAGIISTVNSLLNQDYKQTKILVIDDGSTDDSCNEIEKNFGDNPRVRLIKKPNGGKASALNLGIDYCDTDIFISVDADTYLGLDAVRLLVSHFSDPNVAGVAGKVEIANDYFSLKDKDKTLSFWKNFNLLVLCQNLEYIASQNFDKIGMDKLNAVAVIPGAIGAFRKDLVLKVGKYKTDTLAEDTNLTIDLLRLGKTIRYEKNARCFTEAPESLGQFFKQRFRWNFGTLQVLWKRRSMMLNPKYGPIGYFIMPYMVLGFFTLIINPIVIIVSVVMFIDFIFENKLSFNSALFFDLNGDWKFNLVIGYMILSIVILFYSIIVDTKKHKLSSVLISPITSTVYSYYMGYVALKAFISVLKGGLNGWGHLKRTGKAQFTTNTPISS